MDLIQEGIEQGLIRFNEEANRITYIHQNKSRNYKNPEEKVQAETFLRLILLYQYPVEHIKQFVSVTMGSSRKEADLIVYNDTDFLQPHIMVECKKSDISDAEFKQAINQAHSYAVAEGAKYVWVTSGKAHNVRYEIPDVQPKARKLIGGLPRYGENQPPPYNYVKGGEDSAGRIFDDISILSQDDLTQVFTKAHDSLWGGGELNPSEAFDELDKLIFCKIWDEKKTDYEKPYQFQTFTDINEEVANKKLLGRIKKLYEQGRKKDPEVFKDNIRLTPEKLNTVVGYLEGVNLGDTDLDSKGRAFETFLGSFFRGDFGQYFTPRPIVKFIVDILPINNESLVLDSSCGSGGFLLHALDKVRKQADKKYKHYKTDTKQTLLHHNHWHDFAENNLFGIEINEQIARTAKMNMIIHDDGHTNVIAADGLTPSEDLLEKIKNYDKTNSNGFTYGKLDFIITNPPFGSSVKQTEKAYMHQYKLAMKKADWLNPRGKDTERPNQSTEVLFIEQCHKFLKEGGYLAIVVPDGILTNSSLQYVRDEIEEKYRIVAVVSMPQTAFQATGAGVKSSVLVLKKHTQKTSKDIEDQKAGLQEKIKKEGYFEDKLKQIDKEKKQEIKSLIFFQNTENLQGKALTQSKAYKGWRTSVNAKYKEKIDALKEHLVDQYTEAKQANLDDYPIFMAIAEDIGYDSTGKETKVNELNFIGVELSRFISSIEKGDT